jgi:NhaP-type Na+/H+ or K+/H+ antiporter
MTGIPIILISILIGLILLGVLVGLVIWKLRSEGKVREPDYRAFFIMGMCFLPAGVIFTAAISPGFIGITGMGIIYMAIGLANKDKWGKQNK